MGSAAGARERPRREASREAWDRLQSYLNQTITLLERGSIYGIEPSRDLRDALRLRDLVNPGERETLLGQLHGIRGNVFRKVERVESEPIPSSGLVLIDRSTVELHQTLGDVSVEDKSVRIGDVSGSIEGAVGSDIDISNSFTKIEGSPATDELKTALKELLVAVDRLTPHVADDDRDRVSRDVATLVEEATTKAPRRSIIEAVGDGLVQAAKTAGEIGSPVITLVAQIVALFG